MVTAVAPDPVTVPYNYVPHPGQLAFHRSPARIRVLAMGARWGKDRACIHDLILRCLDIYNRRDPDPTLVPFVHAWIVAPSFGLARQSWMELKEFVPPAFGAVVNESLQQMRWKWPKGQVLIEVKSADDPQKLVSAGLDYLLITEASLVAEEAWLKSLRPRLASPGRAGLAVINSTPRGRNWFYHLYLRGRDPAFPDYQSWNAPSSENPHLDPVEFEKARREMVDLWFRQEMLAEFLADANAVFRDVRDRVGPPPQRYFDATYCGIDWGKERDFTVLTAVRDGYVVETDRFNQVGWDIQGQRAITFLRRHRPAATYVEYNAMGGPMLERLIAAVPELYIEGFQTTNPSKKQIIDGLALALETRRLWLPDDPVLIAELEAFRYEIGASGLVRFSAPEGMHDDHVMSLALAVAAANRFGGGIQHGPDLTQIPQVGAPVYGVLHPEDKDRYGLR